VLKNHFKLIKDETPIRPLPKPTCL